MSDLSAALLSGSAIAPTPQPQPKISPLAEALLRLLGHGQAGSSPSVFDAKAAMDEHRRRLQEALAPDR